jgi:Activator of Hsp90 ATPase homolog 1-like protein
VLAAPGLGAQHAAGWEAYFDRLAALLAGGTLPEEAAHGPIGEDHEAYAAAFGLDPAPGRRAIAGMAFRGLTLQDGPTLRLERRLASSAERVWRALTAEREHWFPGELDVTAEEPPRLLAGRWFGDELRFELEPHGEGCVLVFTHAFADRATAARSAAGWDRCVARLEALLGGAALDERESLTLWPDIHERDAADFGVDPEVGRRAFAAHPLT